MKTTEEQRAELRARVPTSPQSMYQLYVRRDELHPLLDDLDETLADLAKERERAEKAEREICGLRDALAHQTSVADAERGRADRAEEALAECREERDEILRVAKYECTKMRAKVKEAEEYAQRAWLRGKETAEARAEQLGAEVKVLQEDLHEALGYVSDYFRRKHFARYLIGGELVSTLAALPPAGEGGEGQKTSERDGREGGCAVAPLPDVQLHPSRPAEAPQEPGTSSPDDAERAAREWWDANGEACECDAVHTHMTLPSLDALATLLRARDAQAREAGRVEGWTEAVEACANQCQVSIRFNEDPRMAMPIMPTRFRALKRPDRAKGGE